MSTERVDVAVVGGGLLGLAVAWRLSARKMTVAVVDAAPGSGASRVAAGMLAPVTEVHYGEEPLLALNLVAAGRWPDFAAALEEAAGMPIGYRRSGTLAVAFDADDRVVLEELADYQRSLGLEVEVLGARACRELEPLLAPGVGGGILVAGDHSVDNRRVVAALLVACERAGVVLRRVAARALVVADDAARGVALDDGELLEADVVVLAAGAASGTLAGVPEEARVPVRPVKGQIVRCHVPDTYRPLLTRTVRGIARGRPVYLVPRDDGELVIGATAEEKGFDQSVTAGACYELLRAATGLVPLVAEVELVEVNAGLRPGTPDNAPILGPTPLPGLLCATGHYRNGVLLTPVSADALASFVTDGELPEEARRFTLARFAAAPR